jgi:hypothetical protein
MTKNTSEAERISVEQRKETCEEGHGDSAAMIVAWQEPHNSDLSQAAQVRCFLETPSRWHGLPHM